MRGGARGKILSRPRPAAAIGGSRRLAVGGEGRRLTGGASTIQSINYQSVSGIAGGALTGGALLAQARIERPYQGHQRRAAEGVRQGWGRSILRRRIASTAKDSGPRRLCRNCIRFPPIQQAITGAAHQGALTGLDPSVVTGMSPGLKSTILDIQARARPWVPEA